MDVCGQEFDHAVGKFSRTFRTVELKGHSAALEKPTGIKQVGQSAGVIGMQMREETACTCGIRGCNAARRMVTARPASTTKYLPLKMIAVAGPARFGIRHRITGSQQHCFHRAWAGLSQRRRTKHNDDDDEQASHVGELYHRQSMNAVAEDETF